MEIWKDVEGFEGIYQVSSLGRVKSLKRKVKNKHGFRTVEEKILKQASSNTCKYLRVNLVNKVKMVHRLVANAFIENPHNNKIVNHLNFDIYDNRFENLEWCNQLQNMKHSKLNGRMYSKLTERDVKDIKLLIGFVTQNELAKRFNVTQGVISSIKRGDTWTHV